MKISAYHKQQRDEVEMFFPMNGYDKVYMSKIFDFTPDYETCIQADEIVKGGRAYDKAKKLPQEIEAMYPDYSLYGIQNTAYGYLTRGCPRACDFCDVVNLEGRISYKVADLSQFWRNEKEIVLLDPNLLASKDHLELLQQLADSKAHVDFTQGIDARMLTLENAELLSRIKVKMLHFAWDEIKDGTVPYMLWHFKKRSALDFRRLRVYVLTNFNTSIEEDLYRVYRLKEIGFDPYIMIYNKSKAPKQIKRLGRWVNNKFVFRSCEKFEDYKG